MYCTKCGNQHTSNYCPNCGAPAYAGPITQFTQPIQPAQPPEKNTIKKPLYKCTWFWVVISLVLFIALVSSIGNDSKEVDANPTGTLYAAAVTDSQSSASASTPKQTLLVSPTITPTLTESAATQKPATITATPSKTSGPTKTEPPSAQPTPVASSSNATNGQLNALSKAKDYIKFMPFSHDGLIDQLEYEGFTHVEAAYGADNCGANWNEQALKNAKSYLKTMAFSYSGLIKQLEYEKYTGEQATYGVDNCGADWYEQAVKSAAQYLKVMSFSRDGLISQLKFDGFTHDQAVYGAEKNGY